MSQWPAGARILVAGEARTIEPPAERTAIGEDGRGDQVDRATAARATRTVQFRLGSNTDALAWMAWGAAFGSGAFGFRAGAPATTRLVDGLSGVTLTARVEGRRTVWYGAATFEALA